MPFVKHPSEGSLQLGMKSIIPKGWFAYEEALSKYIKP